MLINKNFSKIQLIIRKIAEFAAEKKDCIRADIGTPNIPTPKHIIEATKKALDDSKTQYPPYLGLPQLREAVANSESQKGVQYKKENVIITAGAAHALMLCFAGILKQGELIYILKPYWEYENIAKGIYARVKYVTVKELLAEKPEKNAKAILINSPNNPSGYIYSKQELKDIANYAKQHELFIISDEVYDHLYYQEKPESIVKYAPENALIVNSVSKTYSMTGYRIGWVCGPQQYMDALGKGIRATISCSNPFTMEGALSALTGPQNCVEEIRKEYAERRKHMLKEIKKIRWKCEEPQGAFYFYPDIKQDSWKFTLALLDKANVAVVPGEGFGDKTHIRLCYASLTIPQIKECFVRIRKFLEEEKH